MLAGGIVMGRAAIDAEEAEAIASAERQVEKEIAHIREVMRAEVDTAEKVRQAGVQAAKTAELAAQEAAWGRARSERELAKSSFERRQADAKAEAWVKLAAEKSRSEVASVGKVAEGEVDAARQRASKAEQAAALRVASLKESAVRRAEDSRAHLAGVEAYERERAAALRAAKLEEELARPLEVRVLGGLAGEIICLVAVQRHWNVGDLKAGVEAMDGTPPSQQRLVFRDQPLNEDMEPLQQVLCLDEVPLGSTDPLEVAMTRVDPDWSELLDDIADGMVSLEDLDEEMRENRDVVLAAVREGGWRLQYAGEAALADREVVLVAVSNCGDALQYASEELRRDRQVVLTAVSRAGQALRHASDKLRGDRDIALRAIRESWKGTAAQHVAGELFFCRNFMLDAVVVSPGAMVFAPSHIAENRDFVLEAARLNGLVLEYAGVFKDDYEVVFVALQNSPSALGFAGSAFAKSPDVAARLMDFWSDRFTTRANAQLERLRQALHKADLEYRRL